MIEHSRSPIGTGSEAARQRGSEEEFSPFALTVLRIEDGTVLDVSAFPAGLFPAFGLP